MIIDVQDLNFNVLNFTRSYDLGRQKRGKTLYNNEYVQIERVNEIEGETYKVIAKVQGNYGYYKVELLIKGNMIRESSCTCEDNRNGNICKHIIATCLETIEPHRPSTAEGKRKLIEKQRKEREEAIRQWELKRKEEEERREYERRYYQSLRTIEEYKESRDLISDSTNNLNLEELYEIAKLKVENQDIWPKNLATSIKLEPKIEISKDSKLDINFKIGQTTKYILKNLSELYDAYSSKVPIKYGKNLTFIPKRENFETEQDKNLFDFIIRYAEMVKYAEEANTSYYYSSSGVSNKTISLYGERLDEFFEIVKGQEIIYYEYNGGEQKYIYTDEKLELKINLENKKEKEYILKTNLGNFSYISSDKKIYIFNKNKICSLDKKENEEILKILKYLDYDNNLLIPKDKINEFSTFVLPKIDKYMEINSLPEVYAKEGIIVNKLSSKIFLDVDEKGNITLQLKFCYLDYEFNILEKDHEKYIAENNITRNIPEEKKVLTRIFMDGFQPIKGKNYFLLEDLDYIYEFLSDKIEGYMNDFEVLVTDKFKNQKVKEAKISNVGIKLSNGLLELDISKINFDIDEIKDVLKNYNIKKKYYKLKNGDFLNLEKDENLDFLKDISNTLDINYDKINNGIINLPINRSIYLEKILNKTNKISTTKNDEFTKIINNIDNKNFSDDIVIAKDFENILRSYQKTGYKWLKTLENYGFGGILADDMGLGKTLQVIALLSSNLKDKKRKPSIVVCPSSLVLNWKAEVNKWCNKIKVLIVKGIAENRHNQIKDIEKYDLVITSYDLLKRDIENYEDKKFKYIIADEAQYIKNSTTQNATALKLLDGENKFALTGTPIENSVAELWSIFDFIMPNYLYNYNKFKKKFEQPIIKEEDVEALNRLKTLINPFILRRIKKDVLTELPEKNITIMNNEMSDEQEKIYLSYLAQTQKEISEELSQNGFEKSKFKILMLLTRLRQICCHPKLFIDNYKGESGKLNQCLDIIDDAIESGHKILLFSSYTSMFDILEKELEKKKINYYKLTGGTKVDKRVEMVDNFNKDDNIKLFLISLKAGGTGLNLTSADVVIHYDPWWNVSSENQATDRAYRIGQKNSVQVYKLITTNSIEEKINALQEKKAKISEDLLSTEEKFINKLSKDEIMDLFK